MFNRRTLLQAALAATAIPLAKDLPIGCKRELSILDIARFPPHHSEVLRNTSNLMSVTGGIRGGAAFCCNAIIASRIIGTKATLHDGMQVLGKRKRRSLNVWLVGEKVWSYSGLCKWRYPFKASFIPRSFITDISWDNKREEEPNAMVVEDPVTKQELAKVSFFSPCAAPKDHGHPVDLVFIDCTRAKDTVDAVGMPRLDRITRRTFDAAIRRLQPDGQIIISSHPTQKLRFPGIRSLHIEFGDIANV